MSALRIAAAVILWAAVWMFVTADTAECRKCGWKYLCMRSTLSHRCPKRNCLSEEERNSLKKKIYELND